jgi:multicomponent Na+:H+ antiporter subunit D
VAPSHLAPLAISVPILVACLLLAVGRHLPHRLVDALATAGAAAGTGIDVVLLRATAGGDVVTWTAGWSPSAGFGVGGVGAVGIALVADPLGAGAATVAGALMVAALVYGWHYFDSADAHFHALMLLFLAGMTGFALSGDLFDMFVFFELMSAVAYALTGFKIEDPGAVQGGLAFGIVNSLGAYLTLMGIGLLYGRTGQLGLAALAVTLGERPADALVVGGFVLVVTGFLVKAAVAPFHFWLDDAHAVAPTPVCVLFSGIMVVLGVYGTFRVSTVVFSVLPHADLHRLFLVLGTLTAFVGAVMCVLQRHLKRLLAYSTIAHVGLFVLAFGTLDAEGTAGGALYAAGHAAIKAALFLIAGVILNRYGSVDEIDLHGRGRQARLLPWLMIAAAFALAGLPPFGVGLGKAVAEEAVAKAGAPWAPALFVLVSALTGAAVLRAAARIYFGAGTQPEKDTADQDTSGSEEEPEVGGLLQRVPLTMLAPIVVLFLAGLALGVAPGVPAWFGEAAERFVDRDGYVGTVLTGTPRHGGAALEAGWTASGVGLGLLSSALAVAVASAALYRDRLPDLAGTAARPITAAVRGLRALHSGHVGDYVAWLVAGVAVLGALVALPLR